MFTLWYLYKGYEELRVYADKLKTPSASADSIADKSAPTSIPTPTVTPPTPTTPVPNTPAPKPAPEKSSPIQIPDKKQEDSRPKSREELKLAEGLSKSVISPIDDDELLTRPKAPAERPRTPQVQSEPKTTPVTTPVKEQPQWQPILKPEEPKRTAPVTIPQWDSFPKSNTPKKEDFATSERSQETLSRGEGNGVSKGPQQEFYQRKKQQNGNSDHKVGKFENGQPK